MKKIISALLLFAFYTKAFAVITVTETGSVLTDCGGGVFAMGECPFVPVGNCDGTQGTAKAIEFNYHLPQDTGRYIPVAATSTDITFQTHKGTDSPINWSTRYRQYEIGPPTAQGAKNDVGGVAINNYVLETIPANGDLYLGKTTGAIIGTADYAFVDPDELWYKPDATFTGSDSFTYCAIDSTGRSNIATVNITVSAPASYPLPLGFPTPVVALTETPPADPGGWPGTEVTNFYYIDSDHGSCSDSNTYGYPDVPRCTIPPSGTTFAAGSKMVLADSTSTYPVRTGVSWHLWTFNGTSGNPVWIVGNETDAIKPIISKADSDVHQLRIAAGSNYYRFSGITFESVTLNPQKTSSSPNDWGTDQNALVKNSIIRNVNKVSGGAFTFNIDDVVMWNSAVHDTGEILSNLADEQDVHGIVMNEDGDNHYYLDIVAYANAGDSVQISNNDGSSNGFFGRMTMHSDSENCIDIKAMNNFIVTESDCWDIRKVDYTSGSGGNAQAFYVNDEGPQLGYGYFINNRAWDVGQNLADPYTATLYGSANLTGSRIYLIGNIGFFAPNAKGLSIATGDGETHALFNTFAGVDYGIDAYTTGGTIGDRYIIGNLLYDVTSVDLKFAPNASSITSADYNLTNSNPGTYQYGSSGSPTSTTDIAVFRTNTSQCDNCAENASVTFVNANLYDFELTAGTPVNFVPASIFGTGVGEVPSISDLTTDLSITFTDIFGTTRPQATDYDAGASEDAP